MDFRCYKRISSCYNNMVKKVIISTLSIMIPWIDLIGYVLNTSKPPYTVKIPVKYTVQSCTIITGTTVE